jgi:ATP-binding cassette subfamily F protein uup
MLQSADVLILDEPTNDLDIATLDLLEEGLQSFPGALVVVTHDRYLLDKLCNQVLVLGEGAPTFYTDYEQWQAAREVTETLSVATKPLAPAPPPVRGLSTAERRELAQMEASISAAEERVAEIERTMSLPEVVTDATRLQELWNALPDAKAEVDRLYARWEELEAKRGT